MLIAEIAGSIAFRIAERAYDWLTQNGIPLPSRMYVKRVARELREMPFIYKDLPLDVRADFVEIDLLSADASSSARRTRPSDPFRILVDYRHVVVMGDAGMGKTTLFRLAVQSFDRQFRNESPLKVEEDLIPIFVPLKAIDNSVASPITTFILHNVSYFQGRGGPRRLRNLARKRKLLLLLDAYDEIPYAGSTRSIREEIESLLNPRSTTNLQRAFHNYEESVHDALRECRVWISTRSQFLQIYPLRLSPQVKRILATGMSSQRISLVHKIFERYRKTGGQFLADRLDEEDFMQQLLKHSDPVVAHLSHTPLFLTVLVYTFVNHVTQEKDPKLMWQLGQFELIETCLRLLIEDIDQQKTRGLSDLRRRALLNRRASYTEQKLLFLKFMAAESYLRDISVITESWIQQQAMEFFDRYSEIDDAPTIRRGLEGTDPSTNIVLQLVLSGVFVRAGTTAEGPIYDLPHRRFREKLATDWFYREDGRRQLFDRVGDSQFSELLLVFVERFAFDSDLTQAIVDRICRAGDSGGLGQLLSNCLTKAASKVSANSVVLRLILTLANLDSRPAIASLDKSLFVEHLIHDAYNLEEIKSIERRALAGDDAWLLALALPILFQMSPDSAERVLSECPKESSSRDVVYVLLRAALARPIPQCHEIAFRKTWPRKRIESSSSKDTANVAKIFINELSLTTRRLVVPHLEVYFRSALEPSAETNEFLRILRSHTPEEGSHVTFDLVPREWINATVSAPIIWS